MKILKRMGQISLLTAIIGAVGMISASIFSGWYSASSKTNEINTQVQIVKTTEELHYKELKENLGKIDRKLDILINYKIK